MDLTAEALAAHQRAQLRAVGRTAEEYAALEQALARRRARRTAEAAELEQARHRAQLRWAELLRTQNTAEAAEPDSEEQARYRAQLRWAELLRNQNTAKAAEPDPEEQARHQAQARREEIRRRLELKDPHAVRTVPLVEAMDQVRELIDQGECGLGRAPQPAPARAIPLPEVRGGFRKKEVRMTRRKARGAGWHRRGYRDLGCMWINVQLGKGGCIKGRDVKENRTLRAFVLEVLEDMDRHLEIPETWRRDVHFRKRSLVRTLIDHEDNGAPDWSVLVCDYFDGGETVYFKVFDEFGNEREARDFY